MDTAATTTGGESRKEMRTVIRFTTIIRTTACINLIAALYSCAFCDVGAVIDPIILIGIMGLEWGCVS